MPDGVPFEQLSREKATLVDGDGDAMSIVSTTGAIKVTAVSETGDVVEADSMTGAGVAIEYEHHKIHGGSHYFIVGTTELGNAASIDFQLTTPDTDKWIHMSFNIEGTQQTTIEIFESATVAAGTPITAYNNNRNSTNTTDLTVLQQGGAITNSGTSIYAQTVGVAGNVNRAKQGIAEREREIILKQGRTYRFNILSGGAANQVAYSGEWYEHVSH